MPSTENMTDDEILASGIPGKRSYVLPEERLPSPVEDLVSGDPLLESMDVEPEYQVGQPNIESLIVQDKIARDSSEDDEGFWNQFYGSLESTIFQDNPRTSGRAIEGLGRVSGIDSMKEFGENIVAEYDASPPEEKFVPRVSAPRDVDGLNSALDYIGSTLGQGIGSMAMVVGGAAAGAGVGAAGGAAVGAAGGGVSAIPGAAIGAVSGGATGGAIAGGFLLNYGDTYEYLMETEGMDPESAAEFALIPGAMMAGLDAWGVGRLLGPAKQTLSANIIKRTGQLALRGAGTEGVTEAAQQVIQESAGEIAELTGLATEDIQASQRVENVLNNFVAGVLTGGVMGGATSPFKKGTEAPAPPVESAFTDDNIDVVTEIARPGFAYFTHSIGGGMQRRRMGLMGGLDTLGEGIADAGVLFSVRDTEVGPRFRPFLHDLGFISEGDADGRSVADNLRKKLADRTPYLHDAPVSFLYELPIPPDVDVQYQTVEMDGQTSVNMSGADQVIADASMRLGEPGTEAASTIAERILANRGVSRGRGFNSVLPSEYIRGVFVSGEFMSLEEYRRRVQSRSEAPPPPGVPEEVAPVEKAEKGIVQRHKLFVVPEAVDPYDSDIADTLTPGQMKEKALHDERSRMLEERGYDDHFDTIEEYEAQREAERTGGPEAAVKPQPSLKMWGKGGEPSYYKDDAFVRSIPVTGRTWDAFEGGSWYEIKVEGESRWINDVDLDKASSERPPNASGTGPYGVDGAQGGFVLTGGLYRSSQLVGKLLVFEGENQSPDVAKPLAETQGFETIEDYEAQLERERSTVDILQATLDRLNKTERSVRDQALNGLITDSELQGELNRLDAERASTAILQKYQESDEGRIPSVKAATRIITLDRRLRDGEISQAQFEKSLSKLAAELSAVSMLKEEKRYDTYFERETGPDIVREKLLAARRRGEIDPEMTEMALWLLDQNPNIASALAISLRKTPDKRAPGKLDASGEYHANPTGGLMRIFKTGAGNETTAVHELLHHTERMMPEDVRQGISEAYLSALLKEMNKESTTDVDLAYLKYLAGEESVDPTTNEKINQEGLANALVNGKIPRDYYQYFNPSEFWAVNATRILDGRYQVRGTWVGKAKQYLIELIQKAKSIFGLQSDAPIIRGLQSVLDGDGNIISESMLSAGTEFFGDIDDAPAPAAQPDAPVILKQSPVQVVRELTDEAQAEGIDKLRSLIRDLPEDSKQAYEDFQARYKEVFEMHPDYTVHFASIDEPGWGSGHIWLPKGEYASEYPSIYNNEGAGQETLENVAAGKASPEQYRLVKYVTDNPDVLDKYYEANPDKSSFPVDLAWPTNRLVELVIDAQKEAQKFGITGVTIDDIYSGRFAEMVRDAGGSPGTIPTWNTQIWGSKRVRKGFQEAQKALDDAGIDYKIRIEPPTRVMLVRQLVRDYAYELHKASKEGGPMPPMPNLDIFTKDKESLPQKGSGYETFGAGSASEFSRSAIEGDLSTTLDVLFENVQEAPRQPAMGVSKPEDIAEFVKSPAGTPTERLKWYEQVAEGQRGAAKVLRETAGTQQKLAKAWQTDSGIATIREFEYDIIKEFVSMVGPKRLENIAFAIEPEIRTGMMQGEPLGLYFFGKDIVGISHSAIASGRFVDTTIHELWHGLSQYLPDNTVNDLYTQYARERGEFMRQNPEAFDRSGNLADISMAKNQSTYRFSSFDEWVVEKMKDLSIEDASGRLLERGKATGYSDVPAGKPWERALRALADLVRSHYNQIKALFGRDVARATYLDFMQGKYMEQVRSSPLADVIEITAEDEAMAAERWSSYLDALDADEGVEAAAEGMSEETERFIEHMVSGPAEVVSEQEFSVLASQPPSSKPPAAAPVAPPVAEHYEGSYGRKDHSTRQTIGFIPVEDLLKVAGGMQEEKVFVWDPKTKTYSRNPESEHFKRYDQAKWEELVNSLRQGYDREKGGRIHIIVDPGKPPQVQEGSHRIRAAHEAGLTHIPAQIDYHGHSEWEGLVSSAEPPVKPPSEAESWEVSGKEPGSKKWAGEVSKPPAAAPATLPETPDEIEAAFTALGEAQRGAPEDAMMDVYTVMSGEYAWSLEHVGDLNWRNTTFRGGKLADIDEGMGKIRQTNKSLHKSYGFEKHIKDQIGSEAKVTGRAAGEIESELRAAGQKYADEHRKLTVYNEVQSLSKEAAIALGEWRFDDARTHLAKLQGYVDEGTEAFHARAFRIQPEFARPGSTAAKPPAAANPLAPDIAEIRADPAASQSVLERLDLMDDLESGRKQLREGMRHLDLASYIRNMRKAAVDDYLRSSAKPPAATDVATAGAYTGIGAAALPAAGALMADDEDDLLKSSMRG